MPGFPFMSKMEPLLEIGDNLKLIGGKKSNTFYTVKKVEFVQPVTLDLVTELSDLSTMAAATATAYGKSGNLKLKDYMGFGDGQLILGQYWLNTPMDFLIKVMYPEAANLMYGTQDLVTVIRPKMKTHTTTKVRSGNDTEALNWTGSLTTENTIRTLRIIKILKLLVDNYSASTSIVRLGDGVTGGGTDASAANADISIEVAGNSSAAYGEKDLPKVPFYTGIVDQVSSQPNRIVIEFEEEELNPFTGLNNNQVFVFEDQAPTIELLNMLRITQAEALFNFAGIKYKVEALTDIPRKFVPIPIGRIK